jgi:hypothetical protein
MKEYFGLYPLLLSILSFPLRMEIIFMCSICCWSIYVCTSPYPQYAWLLQCAVFWSEGISVPLNVMMEYRGIEVWCHLFLFFTLDGVNDEFRVPSVLFPGENSRYPFKMSDGNWVQSGRLIEQKNRLILLGFEPPRSSVEYLSHCWGS